MTGAHPPQGPDDPDRRTRESTPKGRRWGRFLPLLLLLIIAVIVGYMLLVGLGSDEDDEVFDSGSPAPAATVVAGLPGGGG